MRTVAVFLVALLWTFTPAIAEEIANIVVMKTKNGTITFNHKNHRSRLACKICHGEGKPKKLPLTRELAHKLCIVCHEVKLAGPTDCAGCHKK